MVVTDWLTLISVAVSAITALLVLAAAIINLWVSVRNAHRKKKARGKEMPRAKSGSTNVPRKREEIDDNPLEV